MVDMEGDHPVPVVVPVTPGAAGAVSLRLYRRPDGVRTGVAFTSFSELTRLMGAEQAHVLMSLSALRSMLADVGVAAVQLDPLMLVGPAPANRAAS
jgi:hypothetical protein